MRSFFQRLHRRHPNLQSALSASEISDLYTLKSQPEDPSAPIQIVNSNVTAVSSRGSHALFIKRPMVPSGQWAGTIGGHHWATAIRLDQVFAWEEKARWGCNRPLMETRQWTENFYFAGGYNFSASSVFDGLNDYILVPHSTIIDFDTSDPYSLSAWIFAPGSNQVSDIISKWIGGH